MTEERTYLDVIKDIIDKERKKAEREQCIEDICRFFFHLAFILLFLVSLRLGFNVCMEPSGDCRDKPESLLFQPRK